MLCRISALLSFWVAISCDNIDSLNLVSVVTETLTVCALQEMNLTPVRLFAKLSNSIRPIAIPSRRYSKMDYTFIQKEITNLLEENIIENSVSPWRAQTLVVHGQHKDRMVIDYSQTINRYTEIDAFPIPLIEDLVQKIAKNKIFSTIDLKSAYHQIPLCEEDRKYTAFEAAGTLYQFRRLPFGLTNAVAVFQRIMIDLIQKYNLNKTYAYLDDIIICGDDEREHDYNLSKFMEVVKEMKLTTNEKKCSIAQKTINYLGYTISDGFMQPDANRLVPLINMPIPGDKASL